MSDWNLYELEDISWDVFGDSCNHLVPLTLDHNNDAGGQLDSHKKARHDLHNESETNAERTEENERNIAEHNEELTFADGNSNVSEQCPSHASKNVSSMEESLNKSVTLNSTEAKKANADIDFTKNAQNDRSNCDFLDYEWPDFENFDVDNLFRNGYSTFGEGSSATANEVSWFPSCYDKTGVSEDNSKLNFQSSCSEINKSSYSEMNAFRSTSDHHGSSNITWNEYGKVASGSYESSNFGYESYDHWLYPDAHNKEDFYLKETVEKIAGPKDIGKAALPKNLDTNRNSYEESSMVTTTTRNVSMASQGTEGKKRGQKLEFVGSYDGPDQINHEVLEAPTQDAYICQIHGDFKNFLVSRPLNFQPPDCPTVEMHNNDASKKILTCSSPVGNARKERKAVHSNKDSAQAPSKHHQLVKNNPSPSTSSQMTSGKKTEESHIGSHLLHKLSIGNRSRKNLNQKASSNQNPTQRISHRREKEVEVCNDLEKASIASFQQLQDVMNQLDIRTKLCIRDGLYRLAQNAEQRHVSESTRRDDKMSTAVSKNTEMNELQSAPGFIDMETGTNPIDRSIAHLLFCKASETPLSPADDTISLESGIVNMKKAGVPAKTEKDGSGANL